MIWNQKISFYKYKVYMLIMTQNLRHWWWNRFKWLLENLLVKEPDVLILTEWRNNKLEILDQIKWLYNHYWIEWLSPIKNSVCILTKKEWVMKETYQNNVLTIEYEWIEISWVYFPQKNEKKKVFQYLLDQVVAKNSLIAWDFNTWKHFTDEQWKTFYCALEFAKLSEEKLTDARKTRHNDKLDYSRYSNAGNGFRIDHILIGNSLNNKVSSCEYDHSFREKWLSDHSMMYLELEL